MDKRTFITNVQNRIGSDISAPPEDCVRAVFQVFHERIEPGQAGHIESHLPKDLKEDWELDITTDTQRTVAGNVEKRGSDEFLEAIRERVGLQSNDDATRAARAVFSTLRESLPEKDVEDTASELPGDLRELWLESST